MSRTSGLDMTGKIACTACGALILVATATSNAGLCMPCSRGTRKHIEAGQRRNEERKLARNNPDPSTKHWRWLVDQVHRADAGFAGLSDENKLYFAVLLLEGEIHNGGFDQYFYNSSADSFTHAVEGLEIIGAEECKRLLVAAKKLLFGSADVPKSQTERLRRMRTVTSSDERKLDELARQFCDASTKLRDGAAAFARKHHLFSAG